MIVSHQGRDQGLQAVLEGRRESADKKRHQKYDDLEVRIGAEGYDAEDREGSGSSQVGRDHDRSQRESVQQHSSEETEDDTRKDLEHVSQGQVDIGVGQLEHEQGDREVGDVIADLGESLSPKETSKPAPEAGIDAMSAPRRRFVAHRSRLGPQDSPMALVPCQQWPSDHRKSPSWLPSSRRCRRSTFDRK